MTVMMAGGVMAVVMMVYFVAVAFGYVLYSGMGAFGTAIVYQTYSRTGGRNKHADIQAKAISDNGFQHLDWYIMYWFQSNRVGESSAVL